MKIVVIFLLPVVTNQLLLSQILLKTKEEGVRWGGALITISRLSKLGMDEGKGALWKGHAIDTLTILEDHLIRGIDRAVTYLQELIEPFMGKRGIVLAVQSMNHQ